MSDSNCATCKHWDTGETYCLVIPTWVPGVDPSYDEMSWEERNRMRRHNIEFEWGREWGTCKRQEAPGSPMFTNDASEYFSALRTKPSHSCAAWQSG